MPLRHRLFSLVAALIAFCPLSLLAQQMLRASPAASPNATPAAGTITTYAGNGYGAGNILSGGYTGDGGPATSAELNGPSGIAFDSAGNLYIADQWNNVVRKVDKATGVITTVAGSTQFCATLLSVANCGDGGPATSAELFYPVGVALDSAGNLYIADEGDNAIRKVDAKTGNITTVAGSYTCHQSGSQWGCLGNKGYAGDGGAATSAELSGPEGVAVDTAGDIYIADTGSNAIRLVSAASGIITTVAGGGSGCAQQTDNAGDGCPATQATLDYPEGIALDAAGDIYLADTNSDTIRRVDAKSGVITTVAGGGTACLNGTDNYGDGCPATEAYFSQPSGVAFDSSGNLLIVNTGVDVIQRVDATTGIITLLAGEPGLYGFTGTGGPATSAELYAPFAVAFDSLGNMYIADQYNNVVREVTYNTTPIAAVPTFSPAAGTYSSAQSVTLSDSTAGATIYYTTDGTTPTTSSLEYGGAITVSQTTTINAIAVASGYTNSAVATATYTIQTPAAAPTFSVAGGTYNSAQTVSISDATAGAAIYYTTNGSTPTTSSTLYSGPITVSSSETINAIATATGYAPSDVASVTYTISAAAAAVPTFSPAPGTYSSAQSVTISDATAGATIYFTTDGSMPTTSSAQYTAAITVSSTTTINAMAVASGYSNSNVATGIYTINLSPDFGISLSPGSLTVTGGQSGTTTVSIAPENGFDSSVSFVCTGLPAGSTCAFSPSTVTPNGSTATTTLTIATSSTSASLHRDRSPLFPGGATFAAAVCFLAWKRRRWTQNLLMVVLLAFGIGWLSGCGGGSNTPTSTTITPATSTVTVTATSGSLQHATQLTLTVN